MTAAERLLVEAEIEAAEAKARRLREGLREVTGGGESVPAPRPTQRRPRGPRMPRPPSPEDLASVTPIVQGAVLRDARRKGMIER